MAWKQVSEKAKDLYYSGKLDSDINSIIYNVKEKRIDDVRIPVRDGMLEVNKPFLCDAKTVLKFTPTKTQLDAVYDKLPEYLERLNGSCNTASLYMGRLVTEDVEKPIKFNEEIIPSSLGYEFKVEVIFPEFLTKRKTLGVDGFNVQKKINEQNYSIAKAICEKAEEEGFETKIREYNCFKEACACPKIVRSDKLKEELKNSPTVNFYAKVYKDISKKSYEKEQRLWLETTPSSLELGVLAGKIPSSYGRDLIRSNGMEGFLEVLGIEVEPETMIDLKKSYRTLSYEFGSKIAKGTKKILAYPFKLSYRGIEKAYEGISTPLEENRKKKREIITETLKEGKAVAGSPNSCIIQIDEQCMLDRAREKVN